MPTTLRIARRFCGPPNSGNGGYVSGLIARHTGCAVTEVTLRRPPPLATDLLFESGDSAFVLRDGDTLIATARPGKVEFSAPPPPPFAEAEQAATRYLGLRAELPFPTCFVCGAGRAPGDGLRIFAGPVDEQPVYAAPWVPDTSLAEAGDIVAPEFVWAALDCPGAFVLMGDSSLPLLLGRMTVGIRRPIRPGERCIVVAWKKGQEGRKYFSGTAIYNQEQELCAVGDAVWILPAAEQPH